MGAHILLPVDQRAEWAFFTNGDDADVQRVWAREHGLKPRASASEILRAQIEEHRADVFYISMRPAGRGFYQESSGLRQKNHRLACRAAPERIVFQVGDAGLLFDPTSVASIKQAILRITGDSVAARAW